MTDAPVFLYANAATVATTGVDVWLTVWVQRGAVQSEPTQVVVPLQVAAGLYAALGRVLDDLARPVPQAHAGLDELQRAMLADMDEDEVSPRTSNVVPFERRQEG